MRRPVGQFYSQTLEAAMSVEELDTSPLPYGELALQTIAMPKDTNANGDIFGGWLLS